MFRREPMTVEKLIEVLTTMEPDAIVVTEGNDHNYRELSEPVTLNADAGGYGTYYEKFDPAGTEPDNEGDKVVKIALFV
jgi:hypothetical protein